MKNILKYLLIFDIFSDLNAIDEYTSCLSNLALLYNYTNLIMPDDIISNIGITITMEKLFKNLCCGPCYTGHTQNIFLKISILFSFNQKFFQYLEVGIYKNIFNNFLVGVNLFVANNNLILIKASLLLKKRIHKITGIIKINYITHCINKPQNVEKISKFTNLNIKIQQKNNILTKLFYFRKSQPNKKNLKKTIECIYQLNHPTHIIINMILSNKNTSTIQINKDIFGCYKRNCQLNNIIYIINNNLQLKNCHYITTEIYSYIDDETFKLILKIFNKHQINKTFLDVASTLSSTFSPLLSSPTSTSFNSKHHN